MLIFLVGYMGCGKSTIGRKLSKALGYPLYDTDAEIVNSENQSIGDLFDSRGETYFREREREVLIGIIAREKDAVISTGGGVPTWSDNMDLMNKAGLTVYLMRSAENIASRLSPHGREKRPKLRGLNDDELVAFMREGIEQRSQFYNKSGLIIDATHYSDDSLVERVISHVEK